MDDNPYQPPRLRRRPIKRPTLRFTVILAALGAAAAALMVVAFSSMFNTTVSIFFPLIGALLGLTLDLILFAMRR